MYNGKTMARTTGSSRAAMHSKNTGRRTEAGAIESSRGSGRAARCHTQARTQGFHRTARHTCTCTSHAHAHAHLMHTHVLMHMHTCTHAHMHTCTHAHMHTCAYAHAHTCTMHHAHAHGTCSRTERLQRGRGRSQVACRASRAGV